MANYERALSNASVRAFLDMIAWAEGADYDSLVNRGRFNHALTDLSWHPHINVNGSTAAGRYQFLADTWEEAAAALNLPDFSAHSQDLAALYLIDRRGGLQQVLNGDLDGAIRAVRREWASLPGAGYGQGEKSIADLRSIFNQALSGSGDLAQSGNSENYFEVSDAGAPSASFTIIGLAVAALTMVFIIEHGR